MNLCHLLLFRKRAFSGWKYDSFQRQGHFIDVHASKTTQVVPEILGTSGHENRLHLFLAAMLGSRSSSDARDSWCYRQSCIFPVGEYIKQRTCNIHGQLFFNPCIISLPISTRNRSMLPWTESVYLMRWSQQSIEQVSPLIIHRDGHILYIFWYDRRPSLTRTVYKPWQCSPTLSKCGGSRLS